MRIRRINALIAALGLLCTHRVYAQIINFFVSGPSYVGPGDVQTYASWYGTIGYNRAYAAPGTNPSVDVQCNGSTLTTYTIAILASGDLNQNGVETHCPGWKAGSNTTTVTKWYDQTGGGRHMGTTAGFLPTLVYNIKNGHAAVFFVSASFQGLFIASGYPTINPPFAMTGVADRTAVNGFTHILASNSNTVTLGYANTANTIHWTANGAIDATASDSAFHSIIGLNNEPTSESVTIDGTTTAGSQGATAITASLSIGFDVGSVGNFLDGYVGETGVISGVPNLSAIHTNNVRNWGTP